MFIFLLLEQKHSKYYRRTTVLGVITVSTEATVKGFFGMLLTNHTVVVDRTDIHYPMTPGETEIQRRYSASDKGSSRMGSDGCHSSPPGA